MFEALASQDPKTLIIALVSGLVPAIIWLVFWLREDDGHPEPFGLLTMTFIVGMLSVILTIPIQKFIQSYVGDEKLLIIIWAGVEEIIKFTVVYVIALRSREVSDPIDFAIYMIAGALGFAALENALFLLEPISIQNTTLSLLTGNLRFLGATLLHAISSGIIGISLGLSYYRGWFAKKTYLLFGLVLAITLHSVFNFLIIKHYDDKLTTAFAFLWIATVLLMLLFERLRRLSNIPQKSIN